MAEFTENYELIKPSSDDYYDVADFNENMDAIDGALAETNAVAAAAASTAEEVNEKIGTGNEGETIFSLLKAGGNGIVKNVQRFTIEVNQTDGHTVATQALTPVDVNKTIVLSNVISGSPDSISTTHTLTEDSFTLTRISGYNGTIRKDIQIVEFY